jgi:hypothetical protein
LCCRSLLVHVWSLYYLYFHVRLLTTPSVYEEKISCCFIFTCMTRLD